jgi:hypothetical protein
VVRLAWSPAPGSSEGYEVALYENDKPVLRERTTRTSLELTVSRHPSGRLSVAPGTYRWYVWPLEHGLRSDTAVVRSKLVLTAG